MHVEHLMIDTSRSLTGRHNLCRIPRKEVVIYKDCVISTYQQASSNMSSSGSFAEIHGRSDRYSFCSSRTVFY